MVLANPNPLVLPLPLPLPPDSADGALEPKLHGAPRQAAALLAAPHHASAQAARRSALADMLGGSGEHGPARRPSPGATEHVSEGAPGAPAVSEPKPTRTPL